MHQKSNLAIARKPHRYNEESNEGYGNTLYFVSQKVEKKKNRNKEIFLTYPTHWQYEIYHKRHGLNCGWHKSLLFPGADEKCDFKAH